MKKLVWITLLTVLFSGCADKSPYAKVVDDSLTDKITVEKINERLNSDSGLKELQVMGTNNTGEYVKLRYRVVWFDKSGFEIDSLGKNWTELPAYKNTDFTIHIIAPSPKAVEYRLFINK